MNKQDYHPDWQDIIRPAILRRDDYKCVICRIGHKERVYKTKGGAYIMVDEFTEQFAIANDLKVFTLHLHVAHLDHDKGHNHYANLASMCPRDHSLHDAEYKRLAKKISANQITEFTKFVLPESLENRKILISQIRELVHEVSNVRISPADALAIIQLVFNPK